MKKLFILLLIVALLPLDIFATDAPSVISQTAVVIDANTGRVLYDKNMHEQMEPASTTKVMTGLLAVELGDLNSTMTASYTAVTSIEPGSTHMGLLEGEQITLEQGLYALSIESANDVANVIAEHISGSIEDFSSLMTQRAKEVGCLNTNFENPHGLHSDKHYTSAYDLAMIARAGLEYEDYIRFFGAETYNIQPTNKRTETRFFHSANWYLNGITPYDNVLLSKTGWTPEATHTMVTVAERNGITLIAVVMASVNKQEKWEDTTKLFDWAFSKYSQVDVPAEYIQIEAPEKMACDDLRKFFVEKETLTTTDCSLLVPAGTKLKDITLKYNTPVSDYTNNTSVINVDFYNGDELVGTSVINGIITEAKTAGMIYNIKPKTETENIIIMLLFSVMTFIGVIISEILINKKI